jgi:hypothetical protein
MRNLGSFNRRVNLPSHPEDRKQFSEGPLAARTAATLNYMYGVRRAEVPYENPLPTGAEKFAESRGRQRMAGSRLGLDLTQSPGIPQVSEPDFIGSAEIRNLS